MTGAGGRRTTAREWVAGARPKTLPAAVAPVAVGTGAAYEVGGAVVWKALLASWSRSPCRSASTTPTTTPTGSAAPTPTGSARCGWSGSGAARAGGGEAGGVRRVRGRGGRRAGAGRRRAPGGCSRSARRRSRPPGSTPAARGRTATPGSARCSSSSSSAWSRCSARRARRPAGGQPERHRRRRRVRACWPARCWSPTTCATLPRDAKAGKHTLAVRLGDARTRSLYVDLRLRAVRPGRPARVALAGGRRAAAAQPAAGDDRRRPRCARARPGPALVPVLAKTGQALLAYGLLLGLGLALAA